MEKKRGVQKQNLKPLVQNQNGSQKLLAQLVSVKGFRTVLAVIRDNSKENKDQGIRIGGYFHAS